MLAFPLTVGLTNLQRLGGINNSSVLLSHCPGARGHVKVLGLVISALSLSSQMTSSLNYPCVCVLICPYRVVVKLNWAPPYDHIYLGCLCKNPVPSMVMLVGMSQWGLYLLLMGHNSVPHIDLSLGAQI